MGSPGHPDFQEMKKNPLLFVAIAAAILWLSGKYRAYRSLELSAGLPRGFRLNGATTLEFDLPIQAFNGSTTAINIGNVDLRVFSTGNKYIGRALAATRNRLGRAGSPFSRRGSISVPSTCWPLCPNS